MYHEDDVRTGEVVRNRRIIAGLSQEELGREVGISFQQIQKYEKGANRISASRLIAIGKALNTSAAAILTEVEGPRDESPFLSAEAAKVARDFEGLQDQNMRNAVRAMIHALVLGAEEDGSAAP